MNSSDGSGGPPWQNEPSGSRPHLKVGGDAASPFSDRASTVMVDTGAEEPTPLPGSIRLAAEEPTPPPVSVRLSQPMPAVGLGAEEPTPPPGTLSFDEPTPPPGALSHGPTPPPMMTGRHGVVKPTGANPPITGSFQGVSQTGGQRAVTGAQRSVGSPVSGTFRAPSAGGPKSGTFRAPSGPPSGPSGPGGPKSGTFQPTGSFQALGSKAGSGTSKGSGGGISPDTMMRLQYAGGGFLGGAFAGVVLGVLNSVLQGWDVVDGLGQIMALAVLMGSGVGLIGALRPERLEELLDQVSFLSDSGSE